MTFQYKPHPPDPESVPDFKSFKLPTIRKIFPKIMPKDLIGVQPLGWALSVGRTYWVRHVDDCWMTSIETDLYDPDYKPHLGVLSQQGYAVWDADLKPIVCTDREIFKKYDVTPENAAATDKPISLSDPRAAHRISEIFFAKCDFGFIRENENEE